jgi:hypothetical protein
MFDLRKVERFDGVDSLDFVERESSILDGIENDPDGPVQFDERRFMNAFADLFRDKNGERHRVPEDDDDDGDDDADDEEIGRMRNRWSKS